MPKVVWALPPPGDAFVLLYGGEDEEGDPVFWVTLDRASRRILSITVQ